MNVASVVFDNAIHSRCSVYKTWLIMDREILELFA